MNTGLGFSEILLIVTLIVVFFGSKELPMFLREVAKFTSRIRKYSDRVKKELDDVARSLEPQPVPFAEQKERKKELRQQYISIRKQLEPGERSQKSEIIARHLLSMDKVQKATMIMIYAETGAEVITMPAIRTLLNLQKRIVLPYCIEGTNQLEIAEIRDPDTDIAPGSRGIPEPLSALRRKLFKSDLEVIVCPGVAFDNQGGRLGRGHGYYDTFLYELRGRVPIIGLAYDCQILQERLPFEYHDVVMDHIVTESGIVFGAPETVKPETSASGKLAG